MNRHERRRSGVKKVDWDKALREIHEDGIGVLELEIVTPVTALMTKDLQTLAAINMWLVQVLPTGRPLCLLCDHEWSPGAQKPSAFLVIKPADAADARNYIVSAICEGCSEKPDLFDLCITKTKDIWPNSRTIDALHPAPERSQ